ncbi:N-formylglutamate amidohydrolase [uncultured Sphingomonas sp.]|uniref:N-formylglutamate amidohydrolase n=1 Tax=uncultured Sphingomonas sp. TaxID=158754 RepID=UPI0035CB38C9
MSGNIALLGADDPSPIVTKNPEGSSSFLLIGDHAGNRIPSVLGDMGLEPSERTRHIAWDIGVARLGELLSAALDAVFVQQVYSRLVIDCNRDPDAADAMPTVSDGTPVPANAALDETRRVARIAAIHKPYQAAIGAEIARRQAKGQPTILIALHSFTPVMRGLARPWQVGILYNDGDPTFAQALLTALRDERDLTVGDNEPYRMDLIDYTIPRHAYPDRLPYAEIEVRQDLIDDDAGCRDWCDRLVRVLGATSMAMG